MIYYLEFKKYITNELNTYIDKFIKYKKYVKNNNITYSDNLFLFIDTKIDLIRWQLKQFIDINWFNNEILFRTLLQDVSLLNIELDYRSASYQESVYSNTFNLDNFSLTDVNYNRYSSKYIKKIEDYLLELYNTNNDYWCLVTSSWMAAYSVIEWLLLRNLYNLNDEIFVPNYIYFESFEQLNNLEKIWINITYWKNDFYSEDAILKYVNANNPRFIFLDSIQNTSDIKIIDIEYILWNLNDNYNKDINIIIDITMSWLDINFKEYKKLNLIIYWSASKYLFNGLDIWMMWFVFLNRKYYDLAERQRRNIWAILYDFQALTFPLLWKDFYNYRLSEITKDASYFYNYFSNDKSFLKNYTIFYWKDKLSNLWKTFYWSIITINFKDSLLRNKVEYKKLINDLIIYANDNNVPLIEWVSFWFSITRISASDVMSKWEPPFLRISIWPNYYNKVKELCIIFKKVLNGYFIN